MRKERLVEFGRRFTSARGERDLVKMAQETGISYEMLRRYGKGLAAPDNPARMEAVARYLGVSVGWLVSGEAKRRVDAQIAANELTKPVRSATLLDIADDAMSFQAPGRLRMLGAGNSVILVPIRAKPGDIVAVASAGGATLRMVRETPSGLAYVPLNPAYAEIDDAKVLGVVIEAAATT